MEMDKSKAMGIHSDLESLMTETEKLRYLASNLCDLVSPLEDAKTPQEQAQKAMDFYGTRKEMQICSSLLMDVLHSIRSDLTGATNELWCLIHEEEQAN